MKPPAIKLVLASLALIPAALFAAQGGGHGAGKVSVHDISITKRANALLAFPGFKGGVFVAAGDVDGDGVVLLQRSAKSCGPGTLTFEFDGDGPEMGPGKAATANNLKQIGVGGFSRAGTILISLLKPAGPDQVKEYATAELSGVQMKRAVLYPRKAGDRPMETLSLNYTKITWNTTPIGSSNGGVWKTTDGGQALIGMLLPAVQKVRTP